MRNASVGKEGALELSPSVPGPRLQAWRHTNLPRAGVERYRDPARAGRGWGVGVGKREGAWHAPGWGEGFQERGWGARLERGLEEEGWEGGGLGGQGPGL